MEHKQTDQKLGHIRHPEFELFSAPGSVHWAAGVACADCHMPYERVGQSKISSHRWQSPLRGNISRASGATTSRRSGSNSRS